MSKEQHLKKQFQTLKDKQQDKFPQLKKNQQRSSSDNFKLLHQKTYSKTQQTLSLQTQFKSTSYKSLEHIPKTHTHKSQTSRYTIIKAFDSISPRETGLFLQMKRGNYKEEKKQLSPRTCKNSYNSDKNFSERIQRQSMQKCSPYRQQNSEVQNGIISQSPIIYKPPIAKKKMNARRSLGAPSDLEKEKNQNCQQLPEILKKYYDSKEEDQSHIKFHSGDFSSNRLDLLKEFCPEVYVEIQGLKSKETSKNNKNCNISISNQKLRQKIDILSNKRKGTLKTFDMWTSKERMKLANYLLQQETERSKSVAATQRVQNMLSKSKNGSSHNSSTYYSSDEENKVNSFKIKNEIAKSNKLLHYNKFDFKNSTDDKLRTLFQINEERAESQTPKQFQKII